MAPRWWPPRSTAGEELPAVRQAVEARMRSLPADYSWFIYRVTNPTIRDMFMHPRNVFKAKQGLLSLLAADLNHGPAFRRSLLKFKLLYYALSAAHPRRGWRRRKFNIQDHGRLRGETVQKEA